MNTKHRAIRKHKKSAKLSTNFSRANTKDSREIFLENFQKSFGNFTEWVDNCLFSYQKPIKFESKSF